MNFSSLLLSAIFHIGIIVSLLTLFNSELHQRNKRNYNFVSLAIVENNFFEKQNQSEILSNESLKINRVKQDKLMQKLTKKNQNSQMPISKYQEKEKEKDFELKKDMKKEKLYTPKLTKKINRNKQLDKQNFFIKKISMSVIPNVENFRGVNQNQKFYTCSSSLRSILVKNKIKKPSVNKNVTITSLLGNNIYNYNPNFINISNLLKTQKTGNQENINITELLNRKIDNIEICN